MPGALWEGAPATVREVRERLTGEPVWAYSTVKTLLDRLVEKGVLEAETVGLSKRYRPGLTREAARRLATRDLAEKAFGGRIGSLLHFLLEDEQLTAKERERLRELLGDARSR